MCQFKWFTFTMSFEGTFSGTDVLTMATNVSFLETLTNQSSGAAFFSVRFQIATSHVVCKLFWKPWTNKIQKSCRYASRGFLLLQKIIHCIIAATFAILMDSLHALSDAGISFCYHSLAVCPSCH